MLSESTLHVIVDHFVKKPFAIPSPGAGMEALRHAECLIAFAKEICGEHPAQALEVVEYAIKCRELAAELAVLQTIPIGMLEAYVTGSVTGSLTVMPDSA